MLQSADGSCLISILHNSPHQGSTVQEKKLVQPEGSKWPCLSVWIIRALTRITRPFVCALSASERCPFCSVLVIQFALRAPSRIPNEPNNTMSPAKESECPSWGQIKKRGPVPKVCPFCQILKFHTCLAFQGQCNLENSNAALSESDYHC